MTTGGTRSTTTWPAGRMAASPSRSTRTWSSEQQVGLSGCSGLCFGPHLHFEVLRESGKFLLTSDPMFNRLWTTWPGRVPFAASYHRESNGGTEIVRPGRTITHWVEFRNIGGRPWRPGPWPGRIVLGTWKPPQHASPFAASDWTSSWLATRVEQNAVGPDEIGRFTVRDPRRRATGQLRRDVQPAVARGALVRPQPAGRVPRTDHRLQPVRVSRIARVAVTRPPGRHGRIDMRRSVAGTFALLIATTTAAACSAPGATAEPTSNVRRERRGVSVRHAQPRARHRHSPRSRPCPTGCR